MLTRKRFIGAMVAAGAAGCTGLHLAGRTRWYRGMLHMHSLWSDGRALPEQAFAAYKDAGYDFVSLTDHNRFQDDPDRWVPLGDGTEKGWPPKTVHPGCYEAYMKRFGKTADVRTRNGRTEIRLLTYAETKLLFDAPGEFLVLPGTEITTNVHRGGQKRDMHMNVVGVDAVIDRARKADLVEQIHGRTPASVMRETYALFEKLAAERGSGKPVYMLNHPQWPYCDMVADDLIAAPEICGFEVCNNTASWKAPEGYADDRYCDVFWDATLARRIAGGQGTLYAFASDDTHFYPGSGIPSSSLFRDGYIMVRAGELTQESIFAAIARGDFYASSELDLDDVSFDAASGTLTVSATPKASERLRIEFIATKKGTPLDPVSFIDVKPSDKLDLTRKIPVYDKGVGAAVKTVEGRPGEALEASYTLTDDDLYVRARIESDARTQCRKADRFHVRHPTAWTQPCRRAGA